MLWTTHSVYLLEFFCSSNDNPLQRKATKQNLCLLAAILVKAYVQMLQEGKKLKIFNISFKKVY